MKLILIKKYKQFEIKYNTLNLFGIYKGKKRLNKFSSENECVCWIDNYRNNKDEELKKLKEKKVEEKKKQGEVKKLATFYKNIKKCLITVDALEFKNFIKNISNMNEDVPMVFDELGMQTIFMDPSNVAMQRRRLNYKEVKNPICIELQMHPKAIMAGLRRFVTEKKNQEIQLSLTPGESENKFVLKVSTSEGNFEVKTEYNDIVREQKVPELEFDACVKMDSKLFKRSLKLCGILNTSVAFEIKDLNFRILSEDDTEALHKVQVDFGTFDIKDSRVKYSYEYLSLIDLRGTLTIAFSSDYPLKVSDEKGNWYILAPRVDND